MQLLLKWGPQTLQSPVLCCVARPFKLLALGNKSNVQGLGVRVFGVGV